MVAQNPRDTYKALLLDYDALLLASDKECSYCLSEREIQMMLGFVDYIAWKTRYLPTETEIDRELIAHWSANLARKLMNGCCGDDAGQLILRRIDPVTGEQQISTDGGVTWIPDPQSLYNQMTVLAPLGGEDGDVKRCEAANNVVNNLKDIQASFARNIEGIEDLEDLMIALIVEIVTVLLLPLAAAAIVSAAVALIPKVLDVCRQILGISKEAYDAMFTNAAWDATLCILYCRADDSGNFSDAAWAGVKSDLREQLGAGALEVGANLASMIDVMGQKGLNNAARLGSGGEGNCDDCDCADCSNLEKWSVIYGTIIEQSPGYLKIAAGDNGIGQKSVRVSTGLDLCCINDCCFVTYNNLGSGAIQNSNYFPCGSTDPAGTVPLEGACGWDFNFVNIFFEDFTVELFFTDCS